MSHFLMAIPQIFVCRHAHISTMSKLFFLGLLGVVVYLVLRGMRRSADAASRPVPPEPAAQTMVACAQCGVHLPQSESLTSGDRFYCCEQHRELGPAPIARKR